VGDAAPYITPSDDVVRAGAWTTAHDDDTVTALPAWLPHWDISHELKLGRVLEIDLDALYEQTRIPPATRLAISVVFASEFEDDVFSDQLEVTTGTANREIEIEIPGSRLGSTLSLVTALMLRDEARQTDQPLAWRRGSILWNDTKKVRLYGDGSQFPVSVVDFADCNLDAAAPWYLEIGSDLELPAMGGVQLLLNSRFPLVVAAAHGGDDDRPELAVVRSALFADIGRTLVEHALSQDNLDRDWPDDSLGVVLAAQLRRFREPATDLRRLHDDYPSQWSAKIAAAFRLLKEPSA
jgi:hypothetical protein